MVTDVFADSAFWIALVVKQDEHHERAQKWATHIHGSITTTEPVILETANALARPNWRPNTIRLIDHLYQRSDVDVVRMDDSLWQAAWDLYCERLDKGWSLTDCVSFVVMQERGLVDALTTDLHFQQAGFRALLLQDP
jgi:hypothetical protein